LSHPSLAAAAVRQSAADGRGRYPVGMRGARGGEVEQGLAELGAWRAELGEPPDGAPESDPRRIARAGAVP